MASSVVAYVGMHTLSLLVFYSCCWLRLEPGTSHTPTSTTHTPLFHPSHTQLLHHSPTLTLSIVITGRFVISGQRMTSTLPWYTSTAATMNCIQTTSTISCVMGSKKVRLLKIDTVYSSSISTPAHLLLSSSYLILCHIPTLTSRRWQSLLHCISTR